MCPGTEGAGCALALALGAYGGGLEGFNSSMNAKKPWWEVGINTVIGAAQALIGAKYVVKLVTKYGPRLAEYLLTTDGFTKSNLTVPYFLNTFAKEFIAGKISDTLIKTTYNKLAGYLSRLFPDKTKKTK